MLGPVVTNLPALSALTFGDETDHEALTIEASMTEANFTNAHLGASGAILLAAFLPKCR